ncbi:MAG: ABC transporter ATP-binding protein [Betaproteobacteria bacterium]|nr:ABC transporter ATP-binding protein [Betaproteobacteria bacterium]
MLAVRGLAKRWPGGALLFDDLDLEVAPGEFVAIVGESGAGKSTLLNALAGLDRADSGSIVIAGTPVDALDEDALARWRRAHVGFVFQQFHLLPYLTVGENVALPLLLNGVPSAARAARAAQLLARMGLAGREDRKPGTLSGGEMQRVAIARAVAHKPRLVLADEPTGNLDEANAGEALALLRDAVKSEGAAGLLVTHSETAAAVADRVLRLAGRRLAPA